MKGLSIATGLDLPIEMVTEPIGILANRGRGKSYATHVLVEEIHGAGVPVVVLDVKGDWWGLRTAADGKSDGLPFYIFGGDHADVPLEPTAGEMMADLVVNERVSVVLDLSIMSKTKARSFTVAFAERLYHRNREPLFVVVDEADVLIPQRSTTETARLLGAMEDIAKRGRGRGLGMAVVTQRPQEVAKSVLDLMDTLILLGMTGPRSLKSINEWISGHVDEDTTASEVMASLPSLPVGEAWIWSPMQQLLKRISVAKVRTFDSHFTPKPGEKRRAPQGRADLDLAALGEQMAATVERAKASDPKALQQRIAQLERELAKPVEAKVERVEVPVLSEDHVRRIEAAYDKLTIGYMEWSEQLSESVELSNAVIDQTAVLRRVLVDAGARAQDDRRAARQQTPAPARPTQPARAVVRPPAAAGDASAVTPARLKLLEALISLESIGVTAAPRNQVALFAGVSPKSSGYANNLGAMNTAGLISYPAKGLVQITDTGRDCVSAVPQLATTEDLHARVRDLIPTARWRIVEPLLEVWPDALSRDDLAERAEVSAGSSGYANNLGALRSLGLLDYPAPGMVAATDVLFLGGAR